MFMLLFVIGRSEAIVYLAPMCIPDNVMIGVARGWLLWDVVPLCLRRCFTTERSLVCVFVGA